MILFNIFPDIWANIKIPIIFIFLFSFILFFTQVQGELIIVDDNYGRWTDYTSIQDAVNNSNNSDTIRIFKGVYSESVIVNTSIQIIGNGTSETIIKGDGIAFHIQADNVTLSNFYISKGGAITTPGSSVYVNGYSQFRIDLCKFHDNSYYPVYLNNSIDSTISRTIINGNPYGIDISNSSSIMLSNINSSNNTHAGLYTSRSDSISIQNSTFMNNEWGIRLDEYSEHIYISNSSIINNDLDGVSIRCYSNNNTISNCKITDNFIGIDILGLDNTTIIGCVISNNTSRGIDVKNSFYNTYSECQLLSNKYGIHTQNVINDTIQNCTIKHNEKNGIVLIDCLDMTIIHNTIMNSSDGIFLYQCDSNEIIDNIISNNEGYGLHLDHYDQGSNSNQIYGNLFEKNKKSPQAHVARGINSWDNGVEGNWWSDYSGADQDGDGIGDVPYSISGDQNNNSDRFPLVYPYSFDDVPDKIAIKLSAFPNSPLEGQSVTIVCKINSSSEYSNATLSILVNGVVYTQLNVDLIAGDTYWAFEWDVIKGPNTIRAVLAKPIDISDEINLEGIKKASSDTRGGITIINLTILIIACVLVNGWNRYYQDHDF